MMKIDFPYPEDFFPRVYHAASIAEDTRFGRNQSDSFHYDETLRDAGTYIEKYSCDKSIPFDISRYNFALFQGIEEKQQSIILFELRMFSHSINRILNIPEKSRIQEIKNSMLGKVVKQGNDEVGTLGTTVYPDAVHVLSLNYEDFPIGYISFDIIGGIVFVQQIQASTIIDEYHNFEEGKNHFLKGFAWRKVLIKFLEDYLIQNGFKGRIIIQAGQNNIYYTDSECLSEDEEKRNGQKEQNKRLEKTYNTTAHEIGYAQCIESPGRKKQVLDFMKTII